MKASFQHVPQECENQTWNNTIYVLKRRHVHHKHTQCQQPYSTVHFTRLSLEMRVVSLRTVNSYSFNTTVTAYISSSLQTEWRMFTLKAIQTVIT